METQPLGTLFPTGSPPPPKRKSPPLDVQRVLHEYEKCWAEALNFEPMWRDAYELLMPERNVLDRTSTPGAKKNTRVFDSSPIYALNRGAGNLIAATQPPERRWIKLEAGPDTPRQFHDRLNDQLEELRDTLFDLIENSADATESLTMAQDMMVSHGAMTIEEGTREAPFVVKSYPAPKVMVKEGPSGHIERRYMKHNVPVSWLQRWWPRIRLTERLAAAMQRAPGDVVEILTVDIDNPGVGQRFAVIDHQAKGEAAIMYEVDRGDPTEPSRWITPRIRKLAGENFGRGPVLDVLPDVRTLNRDEELRLRSKWQRQRPAWLLDAESGLNPHQIRLSPDAFNLVNTDGRDIRQMATPLLGGGAGDLEMDAEMAARRQRIERGLFADQVVPPIEQMDHVTATAIIQRRQQILSERGVDFGRLEREFLAQKIKRYAWIAAQFGLIAPIRIDGRQVKIRFVGPMAQAQDIQESNELLESVAQLGGALGPEQAPFFIDFGAFAEKFDKLRGLPGGVVRSKQEAEQLQAQAAQIATQAAMPQA